MKYSASIASAIAVTALMAPSAVMAADENKTTVLGVPTIKGINDLYKKDAPEKFIHDVVKAFTYRQDDKKAIEKLECDLFLRSSYKEIPASEYFAAHRALLVELVAPGTMKYNDKSAVTTQDKDINNVLLAASLTGEEKISTSPLAGSVPKASDDKEVQKKAAETKKYFDQFCHTLTYHSAQFLIANSTTLLPEPVVTKDATGKDLPLPVVDIAGIAKQNQLVGTTLELCKAHLGDARTLAASVGASVAATALFLAAFL